MHILPRNFYHDSIYPLLHNSSDFFATVAVFLSFGLATLVLVFIAPMALLAVPLACIPIIHEWMDSRKDSAADTMRSARAVADVGLRLHRRSIRFCLGRK